MQSNFIQIEGLTGQTKDKIKQTMKFKTGKFVWKVKFRTHLNSTKVINSQIFVTRKDD